MKKILRHELLLVKGPITATVPLGAKIVAVRGSDSRPGQVINVWMEHSVESKGEEIRTYQFFLTGEEIPCEYDYVAPVIWPGLGVHLCQFVGLKN